MYEEYVYRSTDRVNLCNITYIGEQAANKIVVEIEEHILIVIF